MEIKNLVGELNPYAKKRVEEGAKPQQSAKGAQGQGPESSDTVSVSSEARLRGAAFQEAAQAPDVRSEKVRALKEKVKSGTYKPDIRKAAANLIRDDLHLLMEK